MHKISLQEFLNKNPKLKKASKDNQNQKYNQFEQERQNNIKKCIEKRKELISTAKNPTQKPQQFNKINNTKNTNNTKSNNPKNNNNIIRPKNIETESNLIDKNSNNKKDAVKRRSTIFEEKNRIIMTDDTYVMRNRNGRKSLITKEDLDKITCLRKEKCIFEQKAEEKEEYLKHLIKSELILEKRIKKVTDKINNREKKLNSFLKDKSDGIKFIENERHKDIIDMHERKLLYEKIQSNYNKKINLSSVKNLQTNEKMEELKEHIKDYEKKNERYKKKITKMFDIKENENKLIGEAKKTDKDNYGQMKEFEKKELFEINRFKRENALMNHINRVQDKINGYLEKSDKREKRINQAIEEAEKKREEKKNLHIMHFEEMRNNVKKHETKLEKERQKKMEFYEDKDLKDYAVRQEKIKLNEKKKIMNQLVKDERAQMKTKLRKIMRSKKNLDDIEKDDNFIDNFLYN